MEKNYTYPCQYASSPYKRKQIEECELARLIKFTVLGFGQMQSSVYFLKEVIGKELEIHVLYTQVKKCQAPPLNASSK